MNADDQVDQAVGLHDEPGELPEVVVIGSGPLPQALLAGCRAPGLSTDRDEALAQALDGLPRDGVIGPALYEAVAVLLRHVFAVDGKRQGEQQ